MIHSAHASTLRQWYPIAKFHTTFISVPSLRAQMPFHTIMSTVRLHMNFKHWYPTIHYPKLEPILNPHSLPTTVQMRLILHIITILRYHGPQIPVHPIIPYHPHLRIGLLHDLVIQHALSRILANISVPYALHHGPR